MNVFFSLVGADGTQIDYLDPIPRPIQHIKLNVRKSKTKVNQVPTVTEGTLRPLTELR